MPLTTQASGWTWGRARWAEAERAADRYASQVTSKGSTTCDYWRAREQGSASFCWIENAVCPDIELGV